MHNLHAVVMAGGSGTRFWPASRGHRPKQLLPLAQGKTLIAATVDRVAPMVGIDRTWVVTNQTQAAAIAQAVPSLRADHILVEPEARDTAPCVALAAAAVSANDPSALMAIMPADQLIAPDAAFHALLRRGAALASDGKTLVTFGITPTRPATGYGYIEVGERVDRAEPAAHKVVLFREKPDRATAEGFLASGRFLWNSGIFVWTTQALLAAMDLGAPDLATTTRTMISAARAGDRAGLEKAFLAARKVSVDFGVMEKAKQVTVVRADLSWDDVGSFGTLASVAGADAQGNVKFHNGGASIVLLETKDSTTYAEGKRTVTLFGVHDLVVVAVDDAVLVCPKDRAEDLKTLIGKLKELGRSDIL